MPLHSAKNGGGINMAIYLSDPRYQTLDKIGSTLGQQYDQIQQKKRLDSEMDKGTGFLTGLMNKSKEIANANNQFNTIQDEMQYVNGLKDLNKKWAGYDAAGVAAGDQQRKDIIAKSKALRESAAAKGYLLPGQDVSYDSIQNWIDNRYNTLIDPVIKRLAAAGVDVSQYAKLAAPDANTGQALGAGVGQALGTSVAPALGASVGQTLNTGVSQAPQPNFDVDASITGISNAIKQAQVQNNDPLTTLTGLQKLHLSDAAMQKLAPIANAYAKSNTDNQAIEIAAQLVTERDPVKRVILGQKLNQLYGNKYGEQLAKDLVQKKGMSTVNTNDKVNYVQTTGTNAYGYGDPSVDVIGSFNMGISPTNEKQFALQEKTLSQNDKQFWARLGLQEKELSFKMQQVADANKPATVRMKALSEAASIQERYIGNLTNQLKIMDPFGDSKDPEVAQLRQKLNAAQAEYEKIGGIFKQFVGIGQSGGGQGMSLKTQKAFADVDLAVQEHGADATRQYIQQNRQKFLSQNIDPDALLQSIP